MDKIDRIKRVVETSLKSSFGDVISISDMVVLPTQKFDEMINDWVPDSFSLFVQIKKGSVILNLGWKEFFDIKVNASNEAIIGSIQNPEKIVKASLVLVAHTIGFFVATLLVFRKKDILS